MKFPQPISVRELAIELDAQLLGDDSNVATGINEIHHVEAGDITFSDLAKYFEKSLSSAATVILLNEVAEPPVGKTILVCRDPFAAFDGLIRRFRPIEPQRSTVHHSAEIDPTAQIEPNVIIGNQVKIGKNSWIQANSVIGEHTIIGDDVVIGPNCSIGTEAFYFKKTAAGFQKWRSGGRVIIENRVDIGPGCTIAKGVSGDTIIGEGSKLDAQVHLGHEVQLGKNCLLAAQVGIAGNTKLGDSVVIYGQAGIAQNLVIGDGAIISAKSGVSKNLAGGGRVYFGLPADDTRIKYRELAATRRLPDILKKLEEKLFPQV